MIVRKKNTPAEKTMPTFQLDGPLLWYVLWNLFGFLGAVIVNSFVEWASHKFILHSPKIVKFAYELHDRSHHVMFRSDETYHAQNDEMKDHVRFVPKDYIAFLLVTTPLWVGAEFLLGRPVVVGGVLATLCGLLAFDVWHAFMHIPNDRWFEHTRLFKFLKDHHRLHHQDIRCNLNVVFPLADLAFGTLVRRRG